MAARRWQVRRPVVQDGVRLAVAAREAGVPLRSAQRWLARYRAGGLAALARTGARIEAPPTGGQPTHRRAVHPARPRSCCSVRNLLPDHLAPAWLQTLAQAFPVYWLGLGTRAALLPGSAASLELGHSWRHLDTVAVLSGWAIIGLVLALAVLRRTARREAGSRITERRDTALQRTG